MFKQQSVPVSRQWLSCLSAFKWCCSLISLCWEGWTACGTQNDLTTDKNTFMPIYRMATFQQGPDIDRLHTGFTPTENPRRCCQNHQLGGFWNQRSQPAHLLWSNGCGRDLLSESCCNVFYACFDLLRTHLQSAAKRNKEIPEVN